MNTSVRAATSPRRTQAERRQETIGLLIDATIACLFELGYTHTTTQAVAQRAGLSQGAIFRHFASRQALLVATTDSLADRFLRDYSEKLDASRAAGQGDEIELALRLLSEVTSSPAQIAWFELQLAARTDAALCEASRPIFLRSQQDDIALAKRLFPALLGQVPMAVEVVQLLIQIFHGLTLDAHIDQDPEKKTRMLSATVLIAKLTLQQFQHTALPK